MIVSVFFLRCFGGGVISAITAILRRLSVNDAYELPQCKINSLKMLRR